MKKKNVKLLFLRYWEFLKNTVFHQFLQSAKADIYKPILCIFWIKQLLFWQILYVKRYETASLIQNIKGQVKI